MFNMFNCLSNLQIIRGYTEAEIEKIKANLEPLMIDIVRELGGSTDATHLLTDIQDLVKFEDALADVILKRLIFFIIN